MQFPCEACGAALPPQAMRCPDCHAGRAMRRCADCLHVVDARVGDAPCDCCGGEELTAVEDERAANVGSSDLASSSAPLACPTCAPPLRPSIAGEAPTSHPYREQDGAVDGEPLLSVPTAYGVIGECLSCGGQWLPHPVLAALLDRAQAHAEKGLPYRRPTRTPAALGAHYRRCPCCGGVMNRKNFGERSGVIIDVCRNDGSFVSALELPRMLAFARAGGLAEMHRRLAEEKKKLSREAAAAAHSAAFELSHLRNTPAAGNEWLIKLIVQ